MIAIDFETYLISKEAPVPKPVCLSYYDGKDKGLVVGSKMEQTLTALFKSNEILIAHNMSFELNVITSYYPSLRKDVYRKLKNKEIICTKIYEQLIDCTRKKSINTFNLAALVLNYFNEDISEDKKNPDAWRLRYHELDGIPAEEYPEEARRYAEEDSVWAYKIYTRQRQEMYIDTNISVSADYFLNRMGLTGTTISNDRVLTLELELKRQIEGHLKVLENAGLLTQTKKGYKKNMNVFRELISTKVPNAKKTPKGNVSTSGEDTEQYLTELPENHELKPILTSFVEVMGAEKVLTAFISRLKKAEPYIRTQYKAVVSSGRTSSSTSENFPSVNIQQMPREVKGTTWDIRNCFVPRPGYKMCSIDYSGLELSSTANQLYKITGKGDMLATINSGNEPVDMHSMLAYKLMNMKEKTNESYLSFVTNKKREPYKHYRQMAKPINLGFPGGIGYDTMRGLLAREKVYPKLVILETSKFEEQLSLKRSILRNQGYPVRIRRVAFDKYELIFDELVAFKDELFKLYPDLEYFLKEGHKEFLTGETKMLKNEFGEWEQEDMYKFSVGDFHRDWCQYTQVCNGLLMQSPAAIGAKKSVIRFMEEFSDTDFVIPVAFIHDEIVFEVKEGPKMYGFIDDVAEIMIDSMQSVLTEVRIAVEAELMDYWMKSGGTWSKQYWKNPKDRWVKSK